MDARPGRAPRRSPIVETTVDDGESTWQVVVTAVTAVSDEPVTALPPLYATVDPDALDALFPDDATTGNVTFSYDGFLVVVTAAETVQVYEDSSS